MEKKQTGGEQLLLAYCLKNQIQSEQRQVLLRNQPVCMSYVGILRILVSSRNAASFPAGPLLLCRMLLQLPCSLFLETHSQFRALRNFLVNDSCNTLLLFSGHCSVCFHSWDVKYLMRGMHCSPGANSTDPVWLLTSSLKKHMCTSAGAFSLTSLALFVWLIPIYWFLAFSLLEHLPTLQTLFLLSCCHRTPAYCVLSCNHLQTSLYPH